MYCYKCGVKLAKSEKKCPLCQTKVPKNDKKNEVLAYPKNIEKNSKKINKIYLVRLISLILVLMSMIIVLCNLIAVGRVTWSIYIISSTVYLCSLLLFISRRKVYISIFFSVIINQLFIFLLAYLNNGIYWYFTLAFPLILLSGISSLFFYRLLKHKNVLRILSYSLFYLSFLLIIIELLIDLFRDNLVNLSWSIIAILPMIIIGIIILVVSFNEKLIDEIKRRIFI